MNLTWDFFITMFFVVMTVYGLLLGRSRVYNILINTFVGYVIAGEFGEIILNYIAKQSSVNNAFINSYFGAKTLTFVAVIFILTLKGELSGYDERGIQSTLMTAIYGFLSAGLILSSIFSFMGEGDRVSLLSTSSLASQVVHYRALWLVGPIGAVLFGSFLKDKILGKK